MKQICKHCQNSCKKSPAPECDKFKSFNYEDAKKERNALLLTKDNPKRLAELTQRLSDINGGII